MFIKYKKTTLTLQLQMLLLLQVPPVVIRNVAAAPTAIIAPAAKMQALTE